MILKDRTCVCGVVTEDEEGLSPFELSKKRGMGVYMDVSCGLTFLFVCPSCEQRSQEALTILKDVFGKKAQDLHFSNHLKVIDDKG